MLCRHLVLGWVAQLYFSDFPIAKHTNEKTDLYHNYLLFYAFNWLCPAETI